jgi:hypothetical protein
MIKRIETDFSKYKSDVNINVKILDGWEATDYFTKHKNLNSGQFKYFINLDRYLYPQQNVKFFILENGNEPVGIAHIRRSTDWYKIWYLSFLSIKSSEQNKGYASILSEEMFKYYSKNKLVFETSPYSNEGYKKLKPLFGKLAKKYKVPFVDNETLEGTEDPGYN